ncbi:MAG: alpha/beta fold hydrolase [Magnetococcus sp. YQC-5]
MIQLFCIPFAGGNVYSYQGLNRYLSNRVKMIPLEAPGRGRRSREPLLDTIQGLTDDFLAQIRAKRVGPYALYGHSMGAYLCYLVIRRLLLEHDAPPLHLFISGAAGPARVKPKNATIHHLPKEDFLAAVQQYGGLPNEILASGEMTDYFVPILRADFQAVETEKKVESRLPLDLAMTVMTGSDDKMVTIEQARLWQAESLQPLSFKVLSGEHFFIFNHWPSIGEIIVNKLSLI